MGTPDRKPTHELVLKAYPVNAYVRVKIKRYPRKRKWHHQQHIDYAAQTQLVNHHKARQKVA